MSDSPRVVPGAPPPVSSKNQKKKRKGGKGPAEPSTPQTPVVVLDSVDAALTDKAPGEADVHAGAVAADLVTPTDGLDGPTSQEQGKMSPIAQLILKRQKALGKKISRIKTYSSNDPVSLNEDQKQTLKTLPSLEAVSKELEEVKKAIEVHEAEVAAEQAAKHAESERLQRERVAEAVALGEASYAAKVSNLLTFLRLQQLLSAGHPQAVALNLDEPEGSAIFGATEALLQGSDGHEDVMSGLLSGVGDYQGVPYSRLNDITQLYLNPVAEPTPEEIIEEVIAEAVAEAELEAEVEAENEAAVSGVPGGVPPAGGFLFMQQSELDTPGLEESAVWVDKPEETEQSLHGTVEQTTITEVTVNGQVVEETVEVETTEINAPPTNEGIDWAADDSGLPSLADVVASLGTSENGTPVPEPADHKDVEPSPAYLNGGATPAAEEDDGFTQARGRGRGRPYRGGFRDHRGGFRGGDRGGYRGGDRGGYRGGERGEYRGGDRGEHRGGDRGEYRGGDRGEHRGERGEFRGGDRGGYRGGYRGGEGRGGYRGGEGRGGEGRNGDAREGDFRDGEGRGGYRGSFRGDRGGGGYRRGSGEWRGGEGGGEYRGRGRGRGRGDRGGFHESRGGSVPQPAA